MWFIDSIVVIDGMQWLHAVLFPNGFMELFDGIWYCMEFIDSNDVIDGMQYYMGFSDN